MKKISIIIIVCMLITILIPFNVLADAKSQTKIAINGDYVEFNDSTGYPFVDANNRTQVPFRITLEKFGAVVSWDSDTRTAIAEKDGVKIEVPIGKKHILKDEQIIENDTAALIKDERTYLPIRVVMEAFGLEVSWDSASSTVVIEAPIIKSDIYVEFAPTEEIPYPWFIKIPKGIDKSVNNNIYFTRASYYNQDGEGVDITEYDGNGKIDAYMNFGADELGLVTVGVVMEANHENPKDTFLKDSYFLKPFYVDGYVDDKYRQPHKKFEQIIDESIKVLADYGVTGNKRVIMAGFSGSGILAQRFAVLSPDYVKAIAVGQCGGVLMMPFEEIDGYKLDFPSGINNYSDDRIDGSSYDINAYKEIKQLIYIGNNDSTCPVIYDILEGNNDDIGFLVNKFGVDDPKKMYNQVKYMRENGMNNIYFTMLDQANKKPNVDEVHVTNYELTISFLKDVIENVDEGDYSKYNTSDDKIKELLKVEQVYREDMMHVIELQRSLLD